MEMYNVLVTAISGDVGNSVIKCLSNYNKVNLYGCDIFQYPCGINKVQKCFRVAPCAEKDKYISQLIDICKEKNIHLIIPTNEQEILTLSECRDYFSKRNIQLLLHSKEMYKLFFDKYETALLLKRLGLPQIETVWADEYQGELGFPIIIKKAFSHGSQGLKIIREQSELENAIVHGTGEIVQRYVGNSDNEYTVPVFSHDGGKTVVFLPFRRTLSKNGYTDFLEMADMRYYDVIENMCKKIAKEVTLNGSIDLQMRLENGEFYIFECNPRLSGTVYFRHQLGFEDAVWWVKLVMGEEVIPKFRFPTERFVGIRELNEIIYWE